MAVWCVLAGAGAAAVAVLWSCLPGRVDCRQPLARRIDIPHPWERLERARASRCYEADSCVMDGSCPFVADCRETERPRRGGWIPLDRSGLPPESYPFWRKQVERDRGLSDDQ